MTRVPKLLSLRQPTGPRRRFPHSRARGRPHLDWSEQVDWTGTRLRISEHVGALTLPPEIASPYLRGHEGVTDFVARYAEAAITRHQLTRVLIYDIGGVCLGEVMPPAPKTPF